MEYRLYSGKMCSEIHLEPYRKIHEQAYNIISLCIMHTHYYNDDLHHFDNSR